MESERSWAKRTEPTGDHTGNAGTSSLAMEAAHGVSNVPRNEADPALQVYLAHEG